MRLSPGWKADAAFDAEIFTAFPELKGLIERLKNISQNEMAQKFEVTRSPHKVPTPDKLSGKWIL